MNKVENIVVDNTEWRTRTWDNLMDIWDEYIYAKVDLAHPKFNSFHEGIAVIREEFDELWDEIKHHCSSRGVATVPYNMIKIRKEAIHTAAMVLAFIVELTEQ